MSQFSGGVRDDSANAPPSLALSGIWKRFGGVTALSDVSLSLFSGEIHALVGENGAGKSTLINVASGVHQPDQGNVSIAGQQVRLVGPGSAAAHGIAVVHQERNLVGKFSIAENLFLGRPRVVAGLVSYRRMVADAQPWLERVGLEIEGDVQASYLSPGQVQLVEIAKALALGCQVLLLDEPTASITESEFAHLVEILCSLRDGGASIVFVTHKLDEVYSVCDHVTVLRDGRNILTGSPLAQLSKNDIVKAMVGRSVEIFSSAGRHIAKDGVPRLELANVSTDYGHRDITLTARDGEIVGVYGLVGAGRTELARCIVGLGNLRGGEVRVAGKRAHIRNPYDALRKYGIGYVSEDRKTEGLILKHSVSRNVSITTWDKMDHRFGWISEARVRPLAQRQVEALDVKLHSLSQPAMSLSGGNQQKVSLGKWLAAKVELLIVDEPTVGIDVATREAVHRLLSDLADEGMAVLVISSDLREVLQLSDRVLVMGDFKLLAEIDNAGDYATVSNQIMKVITAGREVGEGDAEATSRRIEARSGA